MYDFQVPIWAKQILVSLYFLGLIQCAYYALVAAYEIRLYAINEYGRVIHEFDPYFNYRAAEYMWANGWKAFREWFDYMSWYPLGRPVGTTMYPGMQITSCFIKKYILPNWSINDICVFVPAWFGVLATASTALLAYECTVGLVGSSKEKKHSGKGVGEAFGSILSDIPIVNVIYEKLVVPLVNLLLDLLQSFTGSTWGLRVASKIESRSTALSSPALECALFTAAIMSIVPAHLLRSVGGGYDNESVATFAMTLTFYCWARSLRGNTSELETVVWGFFTGIAYFYMVMAWGGYVFVLNLIGVHAGFLVLLGRYSTKLHRAYTVFYVVGTILAIQVPVVGWTPLKSLELLGALVAFGGLQLIEVCEVIKRQRKLSTVDAWKLRVAVFGGAGVAAAIVGAILAPTGYFGPVSARVRGLFVKHTKTGNPLVDSVAEHQAASKSAYFQYLSHASTLAPVGFGMVALFFFHDSSSFLIVYGFAAYFFSHRMVRLILLTAPIASVLAGIVLGHGWAWLVSSVLNDDRDNFPSVAMLLGVTEKSSVQEAATQKSGKKKDTKNNGNKKGSSESGKDKESTETIGKLWNRWRLAVVLLVRVAVAVTVIRRGVKYTKEFQRVAEEMAHAISHPTIIAKARTQAGEEVMIDDYREAYWWLRDHTAEDARIMAWWDYGYQITGISNRTTLADGNTWNHEHIALLGRTLTATEKEAHRIARHLADYVLVWAGGGGDDLAKSPHLRRIANSVYRHICPGDPTCRSFGIMHDGTPTPEMEESLLYKLVANGQREGVDVDRNRFREVFISKYGKVRIYKIQSVSRQSKEWVLKNRVCDVPGGWFCRGQYPPALQKILKEKKDFKQLEDFNVKGDDSEYVKQYMENLNNPDKAARQQQKRQKPKKETAAPQRLSDDEIEELNENWENNEATTMMWELISSGRFSDFREALVNNPDLAHIRSEDGRGPMWWAHEYGQKSFIDLLKKLGVTEDRADSNGKTPLSLSK